jgi:hypothetical protein
MSCDKCCCLAARHAHLVEAGTAIDRAVFCGQEWNLRFIPTLGADNRVHFTRRSLAGTSSSIARAIAAHRPAGRAAGGLVHQPFLLVKFLLTRGEGEIVATVAAFERFVLVVQPGTSLVICWYSLLSGPYPCRCHQSPAPFTSEGLTDYLDVPSNLGIREAPRLLARTTGFCSDASR